MMIVLFDPIRNRSVTVSLRDPKDYKRGELEFTFKMAIDPG